MDRGLLADFLRARREGSSRRTPGCRAGDGGGPVVCAARRSRCWPGRGYRKRIVTTFDQAPVAPLPSAQ